MGDAGLKRKLEELHEAVVDQVHDLVVNGRTDPDGNPIPITKEDRQEAIQLLKLNRISVAATPDNPLDALAKALVGSRIPKGHLEARLKVSPHLAALEAADSSAAVVAVEWQPQGQGLDTTP
jgi:hypothetical protein